MALSHVDVVDSDFIDNSPHGLYHRNTSTIYDYDSTGETFTCDSTGCAD